MGFLKYFLFKGLAGSLLGSSIFCTIVECEYVVKDGEIVEVEEGQGEGHFRRFSDQGVWSISKIEEWTFWVLEIEFGNGRANTYFFHNPTDKDHPKICPQNKPLFQVFTDKSGRNFDSRESEFILSDGLKGWRFFYGEFPESNMDVERVAFWENSDHNSYIAYFGYTDKEIFFKKKAESA